MTSKQRVFLYVLVAVLTLVVSLAYALHVSAETPKQKPYKHEDERPVLKIQLYGDGIDDASAQILLDQIGEMFGNEFRIADSIDSVNLDALKGQLEEEEDSGYYSDESRKEIGYYANADFILNVSFRTGYASQISHPALTAGGILDSIVNRDARLLYEGLGEQYVYRVPVMVTMVLKANGDIVAIRSGSGKATGYSENFGKIISLSSFWGDYGSYEMALFDGILKAAKKAKRNTKEM